MIQGSVQSVMTIILKRVFTLVAYRITSNCVVSYHTENRWHFKLLITNHQYPRYHSAATPAMFKNLSKGATIMGMVIAFEDLHRATLTERSTGYSKYHKQKRRAYRFQSRPDPWRTA